MKKLIAIAFLFAILSTPVLAGDIPGDRQPPPPATTTTTSTTSTIATIILTAIGILR